jgi:hypothetical protein
MPASVAERLDHEAETPSLERYQSLFKTPDLSGNVALRVERQDITFHSPSPDRVAIAVAVTNVSGERTPPAAAVLSAAPFGAFVPWRPLAVVPVPSLSSGQTTTLLLDAVRPAVRPLGPPDRVPPRQLLVALGSEDQPARGNRRQSRLFDLARMFGRPGADRADGSAPWPAGGLPADLMELLGKGSVHWAGNLNIFLGGKPVERHMAQALRVYPGRVNMAMFIVGARGHDEYSFHLEGSGRDWDAALYDMTDRSSFMLDRGKDRPVEEGRWVSVVGARAMALAICPPKDSDAGSVEVHVRQRSSGASAVVEFSLDPRAAGPGCYTL